MVLYTAISILLDLTAATFWVIKKAANGVYYIVYGESEEEEIVIEDTISLLKKQNKKIANLQHTVIELTKYIVNNKLETNTNDENIGIDFIDLKGEIV
tara:strand:+ start:2173 stop:2466 length:294 start_codon:yes stop_codon:yes gene_type:complete